VFLKKVAVLLNVKVNSAVFFNTIEYSAQGNRPVFLFPPFLSENWNPALNFQVSTKLKFGHSSCG
jgi:hypothetical protein